MFHLVKLIVLCLWLPAALAQLVSAAGQARLSLSPNSAFLALPAEVQLETQLRAWGVQLSLNVDAELLGLKLLNTRRSRDYREKEKDARGWNLDSVVDIDTGVLRLNAQLEVGPWGQAESQARGERGDSAWITSIEIGSPPQQIPVIPDTGSSDLFIFASTCAQCHPATRATFDAGASPSYRNLSQHWEVVYHDGSGARGYMSSDQLTLDSMRTDLAFGLATELVGDDWLVSAASGVLGLALNGLSTMPDGEVRIGATLFSRLVKQRQLADPVLSIRLDKGRSERGVMQDEGGGQLTFGGIESQYIVAGRAGLTWAPVSSSLYWGFGLDDISLGNSPAMGPNDSTQRRTIIDTGTTLILTSDAIAHAVHAKIPGSRVTKSGTYYIPCDTAYPAAKNLFITIAGHRYGVPVEDLAWKASSKLEGMCISGVQGGLPYFTVLGDVFIKNHYIVLSYEGGKLDRPRVGIGRRSDLPIVL